MRLALFLCVGVLSVPCYAQPTGQGAGESPPTRLTEHDALSRFLATDPRIRALNAGVDEVRFTQAERTLWPNPSATFSRESVLGAHDTFLTASQDLPISGRRRHLQTAGRLAADAAQAAARFEIAQMQSAVRVAYTGLLLAQQREATLEQSIQGLQVLIGLLRTREEGGEGSTYDRMRGQRTLVDLEAERSLAAVDRVRAQGALAAYLGPGTRPETVVAADSLGVAVGAPLIAALVEEALMNRGDYRSSEISVARFEAERIAATRLQIPTPSLTAGLKRSDIGGVADAGYQISVELAVPLFNRGQAATALAAAQKARAQAELESWRLRIEADVRAAYNVLKVHEDRAIRYRESAAAIAEPLAKIGRIGYEEGELSILELLDAERQALDARLQVLELAAAARGAAIELDRVVGREFRP